MNGRSLPVTGAETRTSRSTARPGDGSTTGLTDRTGAWEPKVPTDLQLWRSTETPPPGRPDPSLRGHMCSNNRRSNVMLGIAAAVLFFIAFLINAADIATNDIFASTNVMLIGLLLLALHVAGIGNGRRAGRR
jgi:hypothetical protein